MTAVQSECWSLAVTERRAAAMLGVSAAALRLWRRQGRGPQYVRLGRLVRYRPEDLAAWLESRLTGGGGQ